VKQINERVVQNRGFVFQIPFTGMLIPNTFALTESGKLYAFGAGDKGQLGIELVANQIELKGKSRTRRR